MKESENLIKHTVTVIAIDLSQQAAEGPLEIRMGQLFN